MVVIYVFSMFIGLGVGRGQKISEKINENEIIHTHELSFEDGATQKVKILGKNSLYIFYIMKDKSVVSIAPIEGNIKVIKKLKEEK